MFKLSCIIVVFCVSDSLDGPVFVWDDVAERWQAEVGLVPDAQPDVPVALRGLQAHLQRATAGRATHRRLLVCPAARHPVARQDLRDAKLSLLLRQHLPLGNPRMFWFYVTLQFKPKL